MSIYKPSGPASKKLLNLYKFIYPRRWKRKWRELNEVLSKSSSNSPPPKQSVGITGLLRGGNVSGAEKQ